MSDDDIAQEKAIEAEMEEKCRRVKLAREAIVAVVGRWRRGMPGVSGAVKCPVCHKEGNLLYRRAGTNGHIAARCRTGCVEWME